MVDELRVHTTMRLEILPAHILQKPHSLIQPRHSPRAPFARKTSNIHPILQPQYLLHMRFQSSPQPPHDLTIIPDDASTVPDIRVEGLPTPAYVDHGAFPCAVAVGFGGGEEVVAFPGGEDVVEYHGVGACVHG